MHAFLHQRAIWMKPGLLAGAFATESTITAAEAVLPSCIKRVFRHVGDRLSEWGRWEVSELFLKLIPKPQAEEDFWNPWDSIIKRSQQVSRLRSAYRPTTTTSQNSHGSAACANHVVSVPAAGPARPRQTRQKKNDRSGRS